MVSTDLASGCCLAVLPVLNYGVVHGLRVLGRMCGCVREGLAPAAVRRTGLGQLTSGVCLVGTDCGVVVAFGQRRIAVMSTDDCSEVPIATSLVELPALEGTPTALVVAVPSRGTSCDRLCLIRVCALCCIQWTLHVAYRAMRWCARGGVHVVPVCRRWKRPRCTVSTGRRLSVWHCLARQLGPYHC